MLDADVTVPVEMSAAGRAADVAWQYGTEGFAIVDAQGGIIATNPAFDRLVGHDGLDVAGSDLADLLAPADARSVLSDRYRSDPVPVAGRGVDGFPFLAEVRATALVGDTVLVTARSRLPDLVREPLPSGADRDDLAEALSHDVRGRLRSVAGFLGMCVDHPDASIPPEALECLTRAAAAGRAADRMLERLVRYLRLEHETYRLSPTPLEAVVSDAVELAGGDVAVRAGALPVVFADGALLGEGLAELFRNAREYTRGDEPPTVDVGARTSSGWCELSITDGGRGVPPDLTGDALGLFRQLQPRDWERGVGMGLPICRRIVDGHGGALTIQSDGSTGTTVSVRLALPTSPAHSTGR